AEPVGQPAQRPVGQDPHVARPLAGDGGDLGDLEAGADPQEDDLGLVGRQGGDQGDGGPARDGVEGGPGRVVGGGGGGQGVGGGELGAAAGPGGPARGRP